MRQSKKIVLLDLDGTLISGQSQVHFLFYMFKMGEIDVVSLVRVVIWYLKYKYSSASIDTGLAANIYQKFVGGRTKEALAQIVSGFFSKVLLGKINKPLLRRVLSLQSEGYEIVLTSASIEPIVSKVADYFSFDQSTSTMLAVENGVYTGAVEGGFNEGTQKKDSLISLLGSAHFEGYAFTDSESDVAIFELVSHPVVVSPNRSLRELAEERGWEIM
jgi:HAD superfamily hydrolase (TIGR01490 family)